jgi:hypothetical protein
VFAEEDDDPNSDCEAGATGGGIVKSTGEGVSPGASPQLPLFRTPARVERRRGVDDADFVPRDTRFVEFGVGWTRGEDGRRSLASFACSSSCGDAVRFLRRCWEESGLYASIQGLKGERSKSNSPGEDRGIGGVVLKTRLAGAVRGSCAADM